MVTIIALLVVAVVMLTLHSAQRGSPDLSDHAIATALGRLVSDGAVRVEAGVVQVTGMPLDERRGPIEAITLAAVRRLGTIPMDRLYAAVREARL